MSLKLAMMTATYLCEATKAPREFREHIESNFVKIQSSLAVERYEQRVNGSAASPSPPSSVNPSEDVEAGPVKTPDSLL